MSLSHEVADEWLLLSTCIARMSELHPIYASYPGYARRDLENAIRAGRALLRGQRLGPADSSRELIRAPITAKHRLDLIHNSVSERRPGPYGDTVLFRNVESNWNRVEEYLRVRATEQWPLEKRSARASDAQQRLERPARGPIQGTTGFQDLDRKLFPRMMKLIESGEARSPYGAALILSQEIAGSGTIENKAKRVSAMYRKEHASVRRR
jgi:hypothetical protein